MLVAAMRSVGGRESGADGYGQRGPHPRQDVMRATRGSWAPSLRPLERARWRASEHLGACHEGGNVRGETALAGGCAKIWPSPNWPESARMRSISTRIRLTAVRVCRSRRMFVPGFASLGSIAIDVFRMLEKPAGIGQCLGEIPQKLERSVCEIRLASRDCAHSKI